jgi:hypothetical protein
VSKTKIQLEFDFSPKKETFEECLRRVVYGCGRPLKYIAADIGMKESELSRKLADNPNDPVHYPAKRLPDLIEATNGFDIIYWLVNQFLRDSQKERERALSRVQEILPELKALISTFEGEKE